MRNVKITSDEVKKKMKDLGTIAVDLAELVSLRRNSIAFGHLVDSISKYIDQKQTPTAEQLTVYIDEAFAIHRGVTEWKELVPGQDSIYAGNGE